MSPKMINLRVCYRCTVLMINHFLIPRLSLFDTRKCKNLRQHEIEWNKNRRESRIGICVCFQICFKILVMQSTIFNRFVSQSKELKIALCNQVRNLITQHGMEQK